MLVEPAPFDRLRLGIANNKPSDFKRKLDRVNVS